MLVPYINLSAKDVYAIILFGAVVGAIALYFGKPDLQEWAKFVIGIGVFILFVPLIIKIIKKALDI